MTYGRRGVGKRGVNKSEHAIIYTGKRAPLPLPDEAPQRGERGMLPQSIRVDVDQNTEKLDLLSRLNFGKVYTIEDNVKVRSLGKVNRDSMQALLYQFKLVWEGSTGGQPTAQPRQAPQASQPVSGVSAGQSSAVQWTQAYNTLLANQYTPEQARSVLRTGVPRHVKATSADREDEESDDSTSDEDSETDEAEEE